METLESGAALRRCTKNPGGGHGSAVEWIPTAKPPDQVGSDGLPRQELALV